MRSLLNRLAWITSIGMFLVLIMGTLVTKTGSSAGCGKDWPLCNGKFIPDYTLSSLIEYSHRFVTGIEGFLVLGVFILVILKFKQRDAIIYASSALFFTIVQAVLGALAVQWPQSAPVLALHFGFSLLAFVSTLLLALVLQDAKLIAGNKRAASTPKTITAGFRRLVWFTWVYCYVVVYVGAFVRHTNSSGGCVGWPLCNGELVPEITGAQGIVFVHRLAALALFGLIAMIAYSAKGNKQGERNHFVTQWSFYLVSMQVLSGAFVTFALGTGWYLTAGMIHALIIACLFGALSYLGVLVRSKSN
ncbi:heme A synthase [Paenibacillus psychroresistens]|uniref:Heme A synthase n=1 Tax=Paenibacillus psychroresistens TaxID=1778678 RepID=A0A6B8RHV3_9BACL|nr:COX15/CtaA family protein [Paenibacillus psychroresistens]QGQ94956.1 heme A synthase [Paenibacillus psychroresistens]